MTQVHETPLAADLKNASTRRRPIVVLATSEGHVIYGEHPQQCLSFLCLKSYLSHFRPGQNEALNFSFVVALTLSLLEVYIYRQRLPKRVLTKLFKYFSLTAAFWLLVSEIKAVFIVRCVRYVAMTSVGASLRYDFELFLRHWPAFVLVPLLPAHFVLRFLKLRIIGEKTDMYEGEEEDDEKDPRGRAGDDDSDDSSSGEEPRDPAGATDYAALSFLGSLEGRYTANFHEHNFFILSFFFIQSTL